MALQKCSSQVSDISFKRGQVRCGRNMQGPMNYSKISVSSELGRWRWFSASTVSTSDTERMS